MYFIDDNLTVSNPIPESSSARKTGLKRRNAICKSALKRDFPASLVAPLPSSEQTNLPSSNHTYTKSTPNTSITTSPLCNIHTHDTHHLFNCTHIVPPGFVDRPRRSDCTAGQMDGEAGWWTTSGNIGLPH